MHSTAFAVTSGRRKGRSISIGQYVRTHYPPPKKYSGILGAIYEEAYWTFRQVVFWFLYDWQSNDLDELDVQVVRRKPFSLNELCKTTKFTRNELKILYKDFKQEFPTGVISKDRFKEISRLIFPRRCADSSKYTDLLFNAFDEDGDGQIEFTEFINSISVLSRGSTDEKLNWIFQLYDINRRGAISGDELRTVIGAIFALLNKPTSCMNQTICRRVYELRQKMDLNDDGLIDREEFFVACSQDPTICQSLTGVISADEGLQQCQVGL